MMLAMHPMLSALAPEIVLIVGACIVLIVGLVTARRGGAALLDMLAMLTLAAAFLVLYWTADAKPGMAWSLTQDALVWYARQISLLVGVLILLANRHVPLDMERGEFLSLILFSIAGISLTASANNLIFLFLALELVSVPTYILIGLSRRRIEAQEATGKYFFLGAFAAAMMLYGFSFLYGATGTMQLFPATGEMQGMLVTGSSRSIFGVLSEPEALSSTMVLLGLGLSIAGLAFKIAAAPLHFYVADVYQGAASPITGMLGFVPKFAGFIAIIRILSLCGWAYNDALFWLLWIMAAVTMFVGNTLALMQNNVKRMLAYSGVAHSGYMLVALVAGPGLGGDDASPMRNGVTAVLFYMAVYGVMNLGAFAALAFFRKPEVDDEDAAETLDDLAGAARRHPWASLGLAICVLGLMGFPLTGGLLGKVYVFSAALSASEGTAGHTAMVWLVIIGVINSAIGAAYYLRILSACYLRRTVEEIAPSRCGQLKASLLLSALIVVAVFFFPSVLSRKAQVASDDVPHQKIVVQQSQPQQASVASLPE